MRSEAGREPAEVVAVGTDGLQRLQAALQRFCRLRRQPAVAGRALWPPSLTRRAVSGSLIGRRGSRLWPVWSDSASRGPGQASVCVNVGETVMGKQKLYSQLVETRKACRLCKNLTNPADKSCSQFDSDQIGPWSRWQGYLDADILVVGQDWRGTAYWHRWEGRDEHSGNVTNENLQKLLAHIGVQVRSHESPNVQSRSSRI